MSATVDVGDCMVALAFVGDLSKGQPTNHSLRTAHLAAWLAAEEGADAQEQDTARRIALLRWSGCTANAAGFGEVLGDDVAGRRGLTTGIYAAFNIPRDLLYPLAQIHCEVSGDIAVMLGMPGAVETGLRHIFEIYNGQGMPGVLQHPHVPAAVYRVTLAGDLETLSRVHGLEAALAYVRGKGDVKYPSALVAVMTRCARDWLQRLDAEAALPPVAGTIATGASAGIPLALIADVVDLKLPWLAGFSRQVAQLAQAAAALQGLAPIVGQQVYGAGLIHGIGRAAIPNWIWNTPGRLDAAAWEQVRLAPYWTSRSAPLIPGLTAEIALASHAYERLDGSGYFRGLGDAAIGPPHRILAAAVAWTALCAPRPWRKALDREEARAQLQAEARRGRFDPHAVEAVLAAAHGERLKLPAKAPGVLSERETEVLARISAGASNKEVARSLGLSPSTVRTHVESIFRKLECSTRAAATLKAFSQGIL